MSIRQRTWKTKAGEKKTAWAVDYFDQNRKRHLKSFDKLKDAKAFASKSHTEVLGRVHVADADTITVAEAGKLWLASCDELERSTRAQYQQHLDLHIKPFIGERKLTEITIPVVRSFLDTLKAEGRSAAMLRNVRVSLGSILSDAQERGLVVRNAVKEMGRNKSRAKSAERHEEPVRVGVDLPFPAEAAAMLKAAKGKPRVFLMTAIFTGMRASELRGLRWADVNLDRAEIEVRQRADAYHEIGSPKSSAGRRTIPLVSELVKALKEWKVICPAGDLGLVFPTGTGGIEFHANIIKRWFHPPQIAAGVTVLTDEKDRKGNLVMAAKYSGLHALRHFHASWLINRPEDGGLGLPPKVVQTRLGHSSIQMTLDVYGHLFPKGDDSAAMDAAAALILEPSAT